MLKKKLILAGIVLFMFGLTTSSFAQMKCAGHSGNGHKHNSSDSMAQDSQKKAVEVGNKTCPVLNEKIDERNKATYEYEGKIYNFCCAACIEDFKKDRLHGPYYYISVSEKGKTRMYLLGSKRKEAVYAAARYNDIMKKIYRICEINLRLLLARKEEDEKMEKEED